MKKFIELLKGSPIVVASLVVVVACVAFLFLVVSSGGETFRQDIKKRTSVVNEIRGLESTSFYYPDSNPDAPYKEGKTAINKETLDELARIHRDMHGQYKDIFKEVANYNRTGNKTGIDGPNVHDPMYAGLFPAATADDLLYGGKIAYLDKLKAMLGPDSPNETMPRVNAGDRHLEDYQFEQLQKLEDQFKASRLVQAVVDLSEADQKELWARKRRRLHEIIVDNAAKIDVYATMDSDLDTYPLHIGQWARNPKRPDLRELWDGQMSLWIQQDILRAIQRANNVGQGVAPGKDNPNPLNTAFNVITNPVKHLLSIQVAPGYVGINSGGAMGTVDNFKGLRGRDREGGGVNFNDRRGGGAGNFNAFEQDRGAIRGQPAKELVDAFAAQSPDQPLKDDFKTAATGRVSNTLYDVRHAKLIAVVDYRQIPILMKELSQVNFMTVLNVRITDVDEYQSLRDGYYYGDADAVELEILIESIWLRDWTKDFMPEAIRKMLVVEPAKEAETPTP